MVLMLWPICVYNEDHELFQLDRYNYISEGYSDMPYTSSVDAVCVVISRFTF